VIDAVGWTNTHCTIKVLLRVVAIIVVFNGRHDDGNGLGFSLLRSSGIGGGESFVVFSGREVVRAVAGAVSGVEATATVTSFVVGEELAFISCEGWAFLGEGRDGRRGGRRGLRLVALFALFGGATRFLSRLALGLAHLLGEELLQLGSFVDTVVVDLDNSACPIVELVSRDCVGLFVFRIETREIREHPRLENVSEVGVIKFGWSTDEKGMEGGNVRGPGREGFVSLHAAREEFSVRELFPVCAKEFLAEGVHEYLEGHGGVFGTLGTNPVGNAWVPEVAENLRDLAVSRYVFGVEVILALERKLAANESAYVALVESR
jgi:hypothetical protein